MGFKTIDRQRGARLRQAMAARSDLKMMAMAAEMGVSPAALSKWRQGHAMSVDHASRLCAILGVSLDWLLTGRAGQDGGRLQPVSATEHELLVLLARRPERIARCLVDLVAEIPETTGPGGARSR